MKTTTPTRAEYLERLRDLLPYRETGRILAEVEGLLLDRIEAEQERGPVDGAEAERRALEALGPPEDLAGRLVAAPVTVDLGTRRAYARLLAVVFAVHLLLSILLTVAGGSGPAIPGLLAPLPRAPLAAVFSGVLAVFLLDAGALFLLFALVGRGRVPSALPALHLRPIVRPRDAVLSLVLLGLLFLVFNPFREEIFAVRSGDRLDAFLAPDLVRLVPLLNVVLALSAVRQVAILRSRAEGPVSVGVDALASLGLTVLLGLAATRPELVRFPETAVGREAADVLGALATRVFLLVLVVAALFVAVRFVKRLLRLRQILAEA